jgi:hypothetical protein
VALKNNKLPLTQIMGEREFYFVHTSKLRHKTVQLFAPDLARTVSWFMKLVSLLLGKKTPGSKRI